MAADCTLAREGPEGYSLSVPFLATLSIGADFMNDAFGARSTLQVGDRAYTIYRLEALARAGLPIAKLPFSMRILLENLLRTQDERVVTSQDVEAVGRWDPTATPTREIAFSPSRVLLQDFTGVPAVVDLAAMRDAGVI